MGKFVLFLSLVSLLFLEAGSYFTPADPIMWLANTSTTYILLRSVVSLFIIALLLTTPPRHLLLRVSVGLVASVTLLVVLILTYQSKMLFLDTLSLSAAAVAMGVVALEINRYVVDEVDIEALRKAKIYRESWNG